MNIELHNGDCLEVMATLPDNSIDMVMTDPPYGTTACKWDSIIPLAPMWEQLKRITKPNGAIVMTASQPFTTTLIASNMKMFKYCWVWQKVRATMFQHVRYRPMKKHEDVVIFSGGGAAVGCKMPMVYNPISEQGKPYNDKRTSRVIDSGFMSGGKNVSRKTPVANTGTRNPTTTSLDGFYEASKSVHPTQKPVSLMEYLIRTYTNTGDTVLDFTMGSGTTGVACVNLARNFIGCEKVPEYFTIAKDRIAMAECPDVKADAQIDMFEAVNKEESV